MSWLLSALILLAFYIGYEVCDWFAPAFFSSRVAPYFSWASPHSTLGAFLLSFIFLVPAYAVLYLLMKLLELRWRAVGQAPVGISLFNLSEDGGRASWPAVPVFLTALMLAGCFFAIFVGRIRPQDWTMGVILWFGLTANWLFAGRTAQVEAKVGPVSDEEGERLEPARESAAELVEHLKSAPFYKGQLCYHESENEAPDTPAEASPTVFEQWPPLGEATKKLGISNLCVHQCKFMDALANGSNAVLTTAVGSGKSTALNLFTLHAVLGLRQNVLLICPDERLGEHVDREISDFLEKTGWNWRLRKVAFLSEDIDVDPADPPPDILIVTPHILHRYILAEHQKYDGFFGALGYVLMTDVDLYTGIYGTNVAFVMRRLRRICGSQNASPTLGATGCFITNGSDFMHQLTGEPFEEANHFSTDSRGFWRQETVCWNPPFERQEGKLTSEAALATHKRRSFYDEVCKLATEAFLKNFDIALLGADVLFTKHDIRDTNKEILTRVRNRAESIYAKELRSAVSKLQKKADEVVSIGYDLVGTIDEAVTASLAEASQQVQNENGQNSARVEQQKARAETRQEEMEEQEKKVARFVRVFENLKSCLAEVDVTPAQADEIHEQLTQTVQEMFRAAGPVRDALIRGSRGELARRAQGMIDKAADVLDEGQAMLDGARAKYEWATARASQMERRWIAGEMRQVVARGIEEREVEAAFFLGFPFSVRFLGEQARHIGGADGKPRDSLCCVVASPQPLSQYYAKTIGRNGEQEKQSVTFCAGQRNESVAFMHLRCALYELPGWISEVRDVFPVLPQSFLMQKQIGAQQKVRVEKEGTDISETEELHLTSQEDHLPHQSVSLNSAESGPYRIARAAGGTTRQIDTFDPDRRHELIYPGRVIQIGDGRYRVARIDEAQKSIVVSEEQARVLTEHQAKYDISRATLAVKVSADEALGRLSIKKVRELRLTDKGAKALIEGQMYEVTGLDMSHKELGVTPSLSDKPASEIELLHSWTITRDPSLPFTVEAGPVQVTANLLSFTEYDALDVARKEVRPERIDYAHPRCFETFGLFLVFPEGGIGEGTLHALVHLIKTFIPTVVSCHKHDVEVVFFKKHEEFEAPTIALYDNWTGGVGVSETIWRHREPLFLNGILEKSYQALVECPCRAGCPHCLHIFECRYPEPNTNLDKQGALEALGKILGKEDCEDIIKRRYDKIERDEDGIELRRKIFALLSHNLQMEWEKPVALVVNTKLEKQLEKEQNLSPRVGVWTEEHDTLVVREYPEDQMVHVIAHEYTHDWQFFEGNMDGRLSDKGYIRTDLLRGDDWEKPENLYVEGFAEWVAYRALDFYGLEYIMEPYGKFKSLPVHYRAGFETVKFIEDMWGAWGVMQFIKKPQEFFAEREGWDFEKLYQESGVRDYVLAQLARSHVRKEETDREAEEKSQRSQ